MTDAVYCEKTEVKDRLLINESDTQYDTALDNAISEASRLVDIFLKPYITVPLEEIPSQIAHITADFSASIFKRRWTPQEAKIRGTLQPDMINDVDGTGWFALGLRKVEQYIKSYYVLAEELGNTAHNPDIFMSLFKQGLITGKEARNFINATSAISNKIIDDITKSLDVTETQVLTKDQTLKLDETDTITKTIDVSDTLTKILNETDDIHRTLVDAITKEETLTKTQTDNITQTIKRGETLSTELTDTKMLTQKVDKDEVKDARYPYKKQHSFVFTESDKNGGYKEQD